MPADPGEIDRRPSYAPAQEGQLNTAPRSPRSPMPTANGIRAGAPTSRRIPSRPAPPATPERDSPIADTRHPEIVHASPSIELRWVPMHARLPFRLVARAYSAITSRTYCWVSPHRGGIPSYLLHRALPRIVGGQRQVQPARVLVDQAAQMARSRPAHWSWEVHQRALDIEDRRAGRPRCPASAASAPTRLSANGYPCGIPIRTSNDRAQQRAVQSIVRRLALAMTPR